MKLKNNYYKQTIIVLVCLICSLGVRANMIVKKTIIPLNCDSGVPYEYDEHENIMYITGYDVDKNNRMYFLGGHGRIMLTCFLGNKIEYRQKLNENPCYFHMYQDTCYVYDKWKNQISIYSKEGYYIRQYTLQERPEYLFFMEGNLITTSYTHNRSEITYLQYSLSGQKLGIASNRFGLNDCFTNIIKRNEGIEFKGIYKTMYVFIQPELAKNLEINYYIIFFNKLGKQVSKVLIKKSDNLLTKSFCTPVECNSQALRKLRNDKLYFLEYDKQSRMAVITIVDLSKL